ncbi:nitronate monooxygenase [Roseovarius nanhaiticus]|uniref:Propionate 3-nitronate monooxygenase n=1 Tax=Roseovarius nanhaiticus TaxID=573024 RepID=A0A1N7ERT7_9RHOB|nr:nitronate monooxygenase [Roseovarius nanhaiticus]SEK67949.1 nitronate monooxygenase [Roseovarius nanhaiticus]SIR90780.1 nitronate monooxygenase [Roseovarius nanhaiticus]
MTSTQLGRAASFCETYDLQVPILMAPMAGACPSSLAIAVANGGGMGACGCLLMQPDGIADWARQMRTGSNGAFMLNIWIPDPDPLRDPAHEEKLRAFLGQWGPEVAPEDAEGAMPDFDAQCDAMLAAGPHVISSIMGVFPPSFVARMKERGIKWFATATTVTEALAAEAAGADVIVAQGMEAGGHRGAFQADDAARSLVGLFALVPAVVDAVRVPVVATGGIADARGVAAALVLGASAVQIGTGLLRAPEADISPIWADAIGQALPEGTVATRAFTGRLGRSIRTLYTDAAEDGPTPAPYPIQRNITKPMRTNATEIATTQAWAGQSAGLARAEPAARLIKELWSDAQGLLPA